jgi:hypothetical protein
MYDSKNITEYFILLANNEDDGNITNLKLQKLLDKDSCQDIIPKELIQKYYDEMINDQDLNELFPMIDSFLDFLISMIDSDFSNCLQYTSDMLKDDKALLVSIFGD